MLIGSIVTDILDTIQSGIFWLLLKLDAIVYSFIDWIYQIILMLANGDILGNTNLVDELINRLYIIVGVIILFLVAYSLLRSMVNPDEALKGKESPVKIVQNVIISVVLIAVIPYVFDFAMGFQNSLLQQNTIGRLILGEGSGENASSSMIDDGGFNIAISVFQAFFQPNTSAGYCTGNASIDQNYPDCEDLVAEIGAYNNFEEWWANDVIASKNLFAISEANTLVAQNKISYTFIISTLAGAFVVFVLVSYCIDIAIRLVKLAVFQLIAPLPILARIVPNEQTKKIFSNWLKATISTYVEVFIRLGILFFAVFIIDLVVGNFNTIFNTMGNNLGNVNPVLVLIAQALVILGIILFVKQLPGIIKDITGLDGGKYGFFTGLKGAMQTGAMFGSGITAAVRNFNAKDENGENRSMRKRIASATAGFGSGFGRSFKSADDVKDLKSMRSNIHNSAEEAIKKRIQRENNKLNAQRERDAYIEELNQKRREAGQEEIGAVAGRLKYKAHKAGEAAAEWAGASSYNAVAVQRTQELADKVDAGFSAIEGTWKKSQGFIDAKAEADKASNQFNAMQQAYRNMIAQGMAEEQAKTNIENSWKMTLEEAEIRKNNTKALQEEIERTEQKKKAESIATAARNIQLSVAQYSDIKIDENRVLERESDLGKRAAMESAKTFYGNLDNEENYRSLINDLQSSDREAQNRARSLLDYFDKFNLEAKYQKGEAKYQEEQRKSTIKSNDKGGSSK